MVGDVCVCVCVCVCGCVGVGVGVGGWVGEGGGTCQQDSDNVQATQVIM
jgi:hypothetical protein